MNSSHVPATKGEKAANVRVDAQLARSLFKLGRIARVWPASIMLVLAVLEVLAVGRVGTIIGQFYSIYVDKNISQFRTVLLQSVIFYTAVVVTNTASYAAGQFFAIDWRRRITEHLHASYFQHNVFSSLQSIPAKGTALTRVQPLHACPPSPRASLSPRTDATALTLGLSGAAEEDALLLHPASPTASSATNSFYRLDNPDQRLTQDITDFCISLQSFILKSAKTPFNLVMYSYLCTALFRSALPVVAAFVFFILFGLVHRAVVAALASAVYANQQREGDLRAAHLRVCRTALPIAAANGTAVERRHADRTLAEAIRSQTWLAWCYCAQRFVATAGDYYAVTMNYMTIGIAVFYGTMSSDASSHGASAKDVSQASFYLLMLINSLTSMLDATQKLGEVAGHTARITEFMDQVDAAGAAAQGGAAAAPTAAFERPTRVSAAVPLGVHSLRPPATGMKGQGRQSGEELSTVGDGGAGGLINAFGNACPEELRQEVETLLAPTAAVLPGGRALELSVHRLGSVELQEIVRAVFPACPAGAALLAVCTYQPLVPGGGRGTLPKHAQQKRMDELAEVFVAWEATVSANLRAHGGWCDSVDPRTGVARTTTAGAVYSEATGAKVFLGYPVKAAGGVSMVMHPQHGSGTYPVTMFTTAPFVDVIAALHKACAFEIAAPVAGPVAAAGSAPLLSVYEAEVQSACSLDGLVTEHGRCAARAVTFEVLPGQHLMIRGPPGVGKSTLALALRGLVPLAAGQVRWRQGVRAMFLPQDPVTAPGGSLPAQLAYPDEDDCSPQEVMHLLRVVGLDTLAYRYETTLFPDARMALSRGELQCITIARVLRARPDVAILDEALGAVPIETELRLLDMLMQAGVTIVAVSHRDEAMRVAESVLTIDPTFGDGWQLDHNPS